MQGNGVGVGVFGCNDLTKSLVPLLKEKGFNVNAIYGKSIQEANDYASLLNISFFTNKIDEVLLKKDVLLLFILTPPFSHSIVAAKCLGIGKHVFCMEPIGIGIADAEKMVHAAAYYPQLISMVNCPLRYLPAYVNLKKAINENLIGSIHLIDINVKVSEKNHDNFEWIHDSYMGGGCLTMNGSNVIDLVFFLTGKKAKRVHGIIKTFKQQTEKIQGIRNITAPDFTTFQMELENDLLVTVNIKSYSYGPRNNFEQEEVTVMGQHGNLCVIGGDLICHKRSQNGEFKEEKLYVDMRTSESLYTKGLNKMLSALKESFTFSTDATWNKQPISSAATFNDGLYIQLVIEAIKKSSENRTWIKIETPTLRN